MPLYVELVAAMADFMQNCDAKLLALRGEGLNVERVEPLQSCIGNAGELSS